MTEAWSLATVTTAIAAQSVSVIKIDGTPANVAIKTEDTAKVGIEQQACPILRPAVDNFITPRGNFFGRDSYGADAGLKSCYYTLRYQFFYAPALQGAEILTNYGKSVDALVAVALYFMTHTNNISGATEFKPRIENFSPQTSGDATIFHGGVIAFDVDQYLET